jgi:hypothetical protein
MDSVSWKPEEDETLMIGDVRGHEPGSVGSGAGGALRRVFLRSIFTAGERSSLPYPTS